MYVGQILHARCVRFDRFYWNAPNLAIARQQKRVKDEAGFFACSTDAVVARTETCESKQSPPRFTILQLPEDFF